MAIFPNMSWSCDFQPCRHPTSAENFTEKKQLMIACENCSSLEMWLAKMLKTLLTWLDNKFLLQQLVLLDEHSFIGKNQKLAPKWSGSHKILHLKGESNIEIQLRHNNWKTVVHANRLKPNFVASKNLAAFPDVFPTSTTNSQITQPHQHFPDDVQLPEPEDYSPSHLQLLPTYAQITCHDPSPAIAISLSTTTTTHNCVHTQSSSWQSHAQHKITKPTSSRTHSHTRTQPQQMHAHEGKTPIFFPRSHLTH